MTLFGRIRRGRDDRRGRKSLVADPHWHVHGADFYRVFTALPKLTPAGSLLGLAEGAWRQDVREFFAAWATQPEPSALASVPQDFVHARFIPIDVPSMASLTDLANCHAEPELAIHMIVIHRGASLIEWYDLPGDPIAVASSFGETAVGQFAASVDGEYEMSRPGV